MEQVDASEPTPVDLSFRLLAILKANHGSLFARLSARARSELRAEGEAARAAAALSTVSYGPAMRPRKD